MYSMLARLALFVGQEQKIVSGTGRGSIGHPEAARRGWGSVRETWHARRPLLSLTLGHLTVDSYVGLIPILYPLLIQEFSLDLSRVGLVSFAYVGASSLSQPFFGWVADRYGARVLRFSLLWTAVVFAVIGLAPSFAALLALAAAAGLGSGAYHPFGAVTVREISTQGRRNSATSAYITGGHLGVAAGPLVGAVLFSVFGLRGTILAALPGVIAAAWLLREFVRLPDNTDQRTVDEDGIDDQPREGVGDLHPVRAASVDEGEPGRLSARKIAAALSLASVVGVMMSRNWNLFAIEAFIPTWYDSLGYGVAFYGPLTSVFFLATAIGTPVFGVLADRLGRRLVVAGTLVLSVPTLVAFAVFPGPIAFVTVSLVGFLCAAAAPLTLVAAQQLMGGRTGLASGTVLGLGTMTGAVAVPATGAFADVFGLSAAMLLQAAVALATVPLVLLWPAGEQPAEGLSEPGGN